MNITLTPEHDIHYITRNNIYINRITYTGGTHLRRTVTQKTTSELLSRRFSTHVFGTSLCVASHNNLLYFQDFRNHYIVDYTILLY